MWNDMYNVDVSTASTSEAEDNSSYTSDSLDSKYTVADILSSMATVTGDTNAPKFPGPSAPAYTSNVSSLPMSAPTPTTVAAFLQQTVESERSRQDQLYRESGFVPPIVSPMTTGMPLVKTEPLQTGYYGVQRESSEPAAKRIRVTPPMDGLPMHALAYSNLQRPSTSASYHQQPKTKIGSMDSERRGIRRERNKLAAAKCRQRRVDHTNVLVTETEKLEETQSGLETEIRKLQRQKDQLEFLLEAHKPVCHANDGRPTNVERLEAVPAYTVVRSSRPDSLLLPVTTTASAMEPDVRIAASLVGVPIDTPSAGLNLSSIGLDSMVNGHTGLTPITGIQSCTTTSCATQAQRSSSESSPDSLTSTLMAL